MIVTVPSGSQMDRIVRCPASAALPQIYDANDAPSRDRGNVMHAFLERVPQVGREAALAEVDDVHRAFCESIELAKLADRLTLSTELAAAYNWRADTGRVLEPLDHRAYEIDPTCEIPLTMDLAGVDGATVYSGDYKSGRGWLPAPEQSMQLGLGALVLARIHRAKRAHVEYIRVRDDGDPVRFSAQLDTPGLDAAAERVHVAMTSVERLRSVIDAGTTPNVTEGPWCRYCPARQHCPAKTTLVRAVLREPVGLSLREPLTPDNAAQVYAIIRKAKDAIAFAESALYAYAKTTPIPIGTEEDGSIRMFGELRRPGNERLDGAIAHRVLTARYGGKAANQAVAMEVTKAALNDVVRANLQPGDKITHITAAVLDEIRALGGVSRPETCTTTEFVVTPGGEAKARKRIAGT